MNPNTSRRTARSAAVDAAVAAIVTSFAAGAAAADTFTVTTLADGPVSARGDLPGSLRQAIYDANALPGADVIQFDPALASGTVTLTEGEIEITESVILDGLGADKLTVSGGNNSRLFRLGGLGVNDYTFRGLTLADGNGASPAWNGAGGAILMYFSGADETLNIDRCVIRSNRTVNRPGGAIAIARNTLNITDSAVIDNGFSDGGQGIIYLQDTTCSISNSTISGNAGNFGTVWARSGTGTTRLSISHATFADNENFGIFSSSERSGGSTLVAYDNSIFGDNAGPNFRFGGTTGTITLTSLGHNIIDDATGASPAATDLLDTDPLLGALRQESGTFVHLLRPGSPALNGGDPTAVGGSAGVPEFDQRGDAFARVVGGRVDVGAVEVTEQYCSAADFAAPFGVLDTADVMEFQRFFVAGDRWADIDGSGVLNFLDFVAFRQAFIQGCN